MCNPRKVTINLSQCIAESWQKTIQAHAEGKEDVTEIAHITAEVALDETLGELALDMLERVLAGEFDGFAPWEKDEAGNYYYQLDQVRLQYQPVSHHLTLEAQLTSAIEATAHGAAQASGFTVGEVASEAVARYYDDGWGGQTEEQAKNQAKARAKQRLETAVEALHREQNAVAFESAEAEAEAEAQRVLNAKLATQKAEVRAALRDELQAMLATAQDKAQAIINQAIGEAYRQALRQLVLDNGGQIVVDEQTGTVINMELELY